ncbi:cytochrome P450 [Striga asiatica]|uniref:Cytochrome P450 n=1 Tax=Striga asiatica TaxID=4170 RepID=A0A5A7P2Q6_STRAF|nr:cytochrome P450 [Striga asiatica]
MWAILFFLLPFLLILYLQTQPPKSGRAPRPPGPAHLPLIGNLHQFDGRYPHTYLHRLSLRYGPLVSLRLGFRNVLVISSAKIVHQIQKSHDATFSGRPALVSLQKLSYNGIDVAFSTHNDLWREMRKVSTLHLFSPKQAQSFRPVREDEVSRMVRRIASDAAASRATNLSEMMMMLTSNMICRVALGRGIGYEEGVEYKRFFELFNDVQGVLTGLFLEDYFPGLGWVDRLTGMRGRLEKIFGELDKFYEEMIEEHLDYESRPKSMDGDILDLLLGVKRDGLSSVDLTMDHVKALLMNIIVGGTDAIAAVVVWAMTVLLKNPTMMRKAQSELRQLGRKELISETEIPNLPYLRALVQETFRLYPPAPLLVPRETLAECTIDGYKIEPGTTVHINAWAMGRDPEFWEKPNEFRAERFLEREIDIKARDPMLIPFGMGRRGCPGMVMGLVATELALANLLYAFDWELPRGMKEDDVDFDVLPGMTMHKKSALCAVAKAYIVHD